MARVEDSTSAHFDWLVSGRSRNQRTTLELYKIIEANKVLLEDDIEIQEIVHKLSAIAFSLWRAVFLSDLTRQPTDQLADAQRFCGASLRTTPSSIKRISTQGNGRSSITSTTRSLV